MSHRLPDPAILESEDVNDRSRPVARIVSNARVHHHKRAFGDRPLDVQLLLRVLAGVRVHRRGKEFASGANHGLWWTKPAAT